MKFRSIRLVVALALLTTLSSTACRQAIVIVPAAQRYTATDTLWGRYKDNRVQVTFRFDSLLRVDTVVRVDTAWRGGTRTLVRVDTVRVAVPTPVAVPRPPAGVPRPTTGARVDTVIVMRRDTVRVMGRDTLRITVRDTIRIASRDTIRIVARDTVFRADTVRLVGRRLLFVPPGHYPPEGQCRVWIHDLPPGRQADAAPCDGLGAVPAGAFILFRGDAWDFDYDWVEASQRGRVPPEIVALKRRGGR